MKKIEFDGITPFAFNIMYGMQQRKSHTFQINSHIHEQCEIYINLTGDVSFMVENCLYPVTRGEAIIARPYEYHNCVYNSDLQHEHIWILFSSNGNEDLLDVFFNRNKGEGNLITLSQDNREELIRVCMEMISKELTKAEQYLYFFKILTLLSSGSLTGKKLDKMPSDLAFAINYIEKNLSKKLTVKNVAEKAHVSINTLERRFRECMNITPREFIRQKRLVYAAELLRKGRSVLDAGIESGFEDISHFIRIFRDVWGITPHKYKKKYQSSKNNLKNLL